MLAVSRISKRMEKSKKTPATNVASAYMLKLKHFYVSSNIILANSKYCSIISSNLNWRKSVCSLSLSDADEDSLYLVLGTGLLCCVPDRVIEKSLPFTLLLTAYSC